VRDQAADAGVMRDIAALKRTALLACMVHVARMRARDDLAEMFCKRMAQVTKLAKAELAEIRERQAQMSERLIIHYRSVLACLDPRSPAESAEALRMARRTVEQAGGFEAELADIETVAAHHANNYMPLVARHRRRDRATMFAFTRVVELEATSADRSVLDAVQHALAHAHLTRDFIPDHRDDVRVDLSFASEQWQRVVCDHDHPGRLNRRHFEACVFTYLALFSHFIPCGVWEAVYIIEGLLRNVSDAQPDTIHADTQGQSYPVHALAHLFGFDLLTRIRNWKDLTFYRHAADVRYAHIDSLFGDPGENAINWDLIQTHWADLMQVVLSIREGRLSSTLLLRRLGTESRSNRSCARRSPPRPTRSSPITASPPG
jgi:hypothetical protein